MFDQQCNYVSLCIVDNIKDGAVHVLAGQFEFHLLNASNTAHIASVVGVDFF